MNWKLKLKKTIWVLLLTGFYNSIPFPYFPNVHFLAFAVYLFLDF